MYNKLMYDCITQAVARTTEKPNRIFLEAASKAWAAIFEGGSASSNATPSSSSAVPVNTQTTHIGQRLHAQESSYSPALKRTGGYSDSASSATNQSSSSAGNAGHSVPTNYIDNEKCSADYRPPSSSSFAPTASSSATPASSSTARSSASSTQPSASSSATPAYSSTARSSSSSAQSSASSSAPSSSSSTARQKCSKIAITNQDGVKPIGTYYVYTDNNGMITAITDANGKSVGKELNSKIREKHESCKKNARN